MGATSSFGGAKRIDRDYDGHMLAGTIVLSSHLLKYMPFTFTILIV